MSLEFDEDPPSPPDNMLWLESVVKRVLAALRGMDRSSVEHLVCGLEQSAELLRTYRAGVIHHG